VCSCRTVLRHNEAICAEFEETDRGICLESGSALAASVFAFGDERLSAWPALLRKPAYAALWLGCFLIRQLDRWPAAGDKRSLYGASYFVGRKR